MKTLTSLRALILATVLLGAVILGVRQASAASTGQIYVSPSTATVQNGSNVTVSVRLNPGTGYNVNGAQFTLNFDPAKLKYVSVDTSGSAFNFSVAQTATASSVTVSRALLSQYVTTDSLIASVTLQAVSGSGSSALTLSDANAASPDNNGTWLNPTTVDGSVTLTSGSTTTPPPTSPPPSGGSTGTGTPTAPKTTTSGSTTNTSPSTPSGTSSSTPPIVEESGSNTGIIDSQFTIVNVSFKTSVPTQVYIRYGIDKSLNLQTALSPADTTHNVSLDQSLLTPGQTYYYQIVVKDNKGNQTASAIESFTTKGYTVKFVVTDKNGHRMAHTKVELHSTPMTAETDGDGVATFENVSPGQHHLIYTAGSHEFSQAVTVNNTVATDTATGRQAAAPQTVSIQFAAAKSNALIAPFTIFGLIILVVIVFLLRGRLSGTARQPIVATATAYPVTTGLVTPPAPTDTTDPSHVSIENAHGVGTPNPGSVVTPVEPKPKEKEE